ncbi:hypothetical protein GQ602_004915 [Ophiocordyceps camponoti-floridani]|uniref:Uncharacterized protein n=1 Tax=Ophiocordyceps camponoti-floridani TaxID=2030778 RepID=A0A8H4Q568_9HYPO|nr:hypothetical protein GQ602_004915 [Ophiocordyceps camponoti-floridani]
MAAAAAPDDTALPGPSSRAPARVDEGLRQRRRLSPDSDAGRTITRRSSLLSDLSCDTAVREGLSSSRVVREPARVDEVSTVASASLAFALLPAVAGALFTNGHAVVTDIMLLALAGVFLHWSVTQPWVWYRAAQQVRLLHAGEGDDALDDAVDDRPEPGSDSQPSSTTATTTTTTTTMTRRQAGAVRELYIHEMLALLSCLGFPLASAYLLHAIRAQLSRPSEGLVSNYNLSIFLLVAELRVFSHVLKLVRERTLHLQRVAHADQLVPVQSAADGLAGRIAVLEAAVASGQQQQQQQQQQQGGVVGTGGVVKNDAALTRDVRNAIQPELDALNRAVRRYEKKATLLQMQTEARFSAVDARLEDAVALAAAAAKHSALPRRRGSTSVVVSVVLAPFRLLLRLALLPLTLGRVLLARAGDSPRQFPAGGNPSSRSGRAVGRASPRYDRVPTRVARR